MLPPNVPRVHWNPECQQVEGKEQFAAIAKDTTHKKIVVLIPSKTDEHPEEVTYNISYFFNAWRVYPSNFSDFFTANVQKQQIKTALTRRLNNPNPEFCGYVVITSLTEPILTTVTWIDTLLEKHKFQRTPCTTLDKKLTQHFPEEFLERSYFVVIPDTDEIPTPPKDDFPIDCFSVIEDCVAVTYKDTYFIRKSILSDLDVHFHELIHVIQWHVLGPETFIVNYYFQAATHNSHEKLPLEDMAIYLTENFIEAEHRLSYYDYTVEETKKFKENFVISDTS
ncbi:hypothetical protein SOPP22_01955 [Shewanella sp. OPT22]|nr:hypothetical protein SOPP22_01955 [Shewanella sp. OPT22]